MDSRYEHEVRARRGVGRCCEGTKAHQPSPFFFLPRSSTTGNKCFLSRYVHNFAQIVPPHTLLLNLKPVSSSLLHSTRTFRTKHVCFHPAHALSEHCRSQRWLNVVSNSTHHSSAYATKPIRSMPAHYAPPSFPRRQCRKL